MDYCFCASLPVPTPLLVLLKSCLLFLNWVSLQEGLFELEVGYILPPVCNSPPVAGHWLFVCPPPPLFWGRKSLSNWSLNLYDFAPSPTPSSSPIWGISSIPMVQFRLDLQAVLLNPPSPPFATYSHCAFCTHLQPFLLPSFDNYFLLMLLLRLLFEEKKKSKKTFQTEGLCVTAYLTYQNIFIGDHMHFFC